MTEFEFEFESALQSMASITEVLDAAGFDDRVPSHGTHPGEGYPLHPPQQIDGTW